jgi:ataxia telangiectasia mutated family protein
MRPAVFQKQIKDIRDSSSDMIGQVFPRLDEAFRKACDNIKPVMRHFFHEHHKDPMGWFAMRLNYSRSAAAASVIGHVLGLGDRHISNILIDNSSGELVHIDLGIAFEQVC